MAKQTHKQSQKGPRDYERPDAHESAFIETNNPPEHPLSESTGTDTNISGAVIKTIPEQEPPRKRPASSKPSGGKHAA